MTREPRVRLGIWLGFGMPANATKKPRLSRVKLESIGSIAVAGKSRGLCEATQCQLAVSRAAATPSEPDKGERARMSLGKS